MMLPVIDLSSSDRISAAHSIRQACTDYGFFYLINHGVDELVLQNVFEQSRLFFSLPLEDKMKCSRNGGDFGFSPLYAENLDSSSSKTKGDSKETFHIGPLQNQLNQWPSQDLLPSWRSVMENYYTSLLSTGKKLSSLIALALNLDDHFFHSIGALDKPYAFLRLLHYPGEMGDSDEDGVVYGASAHSDYGMITLLATDGVPGLQVCREKLKHPRTWENVNHVKGAFIVNLGDMMERWTNCLFRSTLHRVMPTGKERYSEKLIFKEQIEALLRENSILKRVVAIQHERQKEYEERNQEVQQLKQMISQYQERCRTLEVTNYALQMHLQQAEESSSIPGRFHHDIF